MLVAVQQLNSVIYQDLSSFDVQMELSHFPLMCMLKTLELKTFAKKKKVSVLGEKNFL